MARTRVHAPGPTESPFEEQRRAQRFVWRGHVDIIVESPTRNSVRVELFDVSAHGFRIHYRGEPLPSGTEFTFHHRLFHGRGRVMWLRYSAGQNEGGCLVVAG